MTDFDYPNEPEWVMDEAKRIHEEEGIDVYVLKSSAFYGFHLISFDILHWMKVKSIQAGLRLKTDYPFINSRYSVIAKGVKLVQKHFLTLRIGEKLLKGSPKFFCRFVSPNPFMKSITHYKIYQKFCGVPEAPEWYKDNWIYVNPLISIYKTFHHLGGKSA